MCVNATLFLEEKMRNGEWYIVGPEQMIQVHLLRQNGSIERRSPCPDEDSFFV